MLDLDDRERVREREAFEVQVRVHLEQLGTRESRCSSSDPFRMLEGGGDSISDTSEYDEHAEAYEGEQETDKTGSTADLQLCGEELRRAASCPRLTQPYGARSQAASLPVPLAPPLVPPASSPYMSASPGPTTPASLQ